jgi:TonB family protein
MMIRILLACAMAAGLRAQSAALPDDVDAAIRSAQTQHDAAALDALAATAMNELRYDQARKLLDAALQIRAQASGAPSPDYAVGLLQLAELEVRQHGLIDAQTLYSQAAKLLAGRTEGAAALIRLGQIALASMHFDEAASYFERAREADPSKAAVATLWVAVTRMKQDASAEADALFKGAFEAADPKDVEMIAAVYGVFLRREGRRAEANALAQRARDRYMAFWDAHRAEPARPPGTSGPFRIGGGVTAPFVSSRIEPRYSDEARLAGLSGTVILHLVVSEGGKARDIVVGHSLGMGLDERAIEAVSQWKFKPGTKDGKAVPVFATVEVRFGMP